MRTRLLQLTRLLFINLLLMAMALTAFSIAAERLPINNANDVIATEFVNASTNRLLNDNLLERKIVNKIYLETMLLKYNISSSLMSNAESSTNTVNNLLHSNFIIPVQNKTQLQYEWGLSLVFVLTLLLLPHQHSLYVFIIAVLLNFTVTIYLYHFKQIWLSPTIALVLLTSDFILWIGWQQYTAWRYIKNELMQIETTDIEMFNEQQSQSQFARMKSVVEQFKHHSKEMIPTNESNRELISFLSHDMRTPLINILALTSLLRERKQETNQYSEQDNALLLTQIEQNVAHTLHYSQSLIELNQIQTDPIRRESVNLQHLINYAAEHIQIQARRYNIRLHIEPCPDADRWAWIEGDGDLIERALINVISNAIRNSKPNQTIHIRLQQLPNRLHHSAVISIQDHGQGMDETTRQRLLSGQGSKPSKEKQYADGTQSLGIGWRMIHAIVIDKHHGQIDIHSQLGVGTTVMLKFTCSEMQIESESLPD